MFINSKNMFISDFHRLYKEDGLTTRVIELFQELIYDFYKNSKRKFPFREKVTPYNVVISEIMLQQTQTGRVSKKFLKFIEKFPDFLSLSNASIEDILKEWKGLGYNRRAIALKKIAEIVINDFDGKLPDSIETLKSFPQIGHNTASSIITFAFNKATVFIETNVRRVYIYFFFPNKNQVNDKEILPIVERTVDTNNAREWYYALMDYGVMLKKTYPELGKKSVHYRKQSSFNGSNRQIRGKILKMMIKNRFIKKSTIIEKFNNLSFERINSILSQLEKEGFLRINGDHIKFAK